MTNLRQQLLFLGLLLMVTSTIIGCTKRTNKNQNLECQTDMDCSAANDPYCDSENKCVACDEPAHCPCHEACVEGSCNPLGALTLSSSLNSHGNWLGSPGSDSYTFDGLCTSNDDCSLGQICNPLTAGCIGASIFSTECQTDLDCPSGPNGEILVCEPASAKCMPAARCLDITNCCGVDNFRCDASSQTCRPQQSECIPPAPPTSTCPFEPKQDEECPTGYFCSPLGECVQCTCNDDCSPGQKCFAPTRSCRDLNYCESTNDCPKIDEACDLQAHECSPYCDANNEAEVCPSDKYCKLSEHVCRPRAELPCEEDTYAPNHSSASAFTIATPEVGHSRRISNLSLCDDSPDWFKFTLATGQTLYVSLTAGPDLRAIYEIIAQDTTTTLVKANVGITSQVLNFTAGQSGTYYLRISPVDRTTGNYALTLNLEMTTNVCEDPLEESVQDNTPSTARILFEDGQLAPPDGCTPETTANGVSITCPASQLKLCQSDVDYYAYKLSSGANWKIEASDFSTNLALKIFGPFTSLSDYSDNLVLAQETTSSPTKVLVGSFRNPGWAVLRVSRVGNAETNYRLKMTVDEPMPACQEDLADGPVAWDHNSLTISDSAGINDVAAQATELGLELGQISIDGRLCNSDHDWYKLKKEQDGTLQPLPANHRIKISVSSPAPSKLILELGPSAQELTAHNLEEGFELLESTASLESMFLRIRQTEASTTDLTYTITLELIAPPSCTANPNLTQADAIRLDAGANGLDFPYTLCEDEELWFHFELNPTDKQNLLAITHQENGESGGISLEMRSPIGTTNSTLLTDSSSFPKSATQLVQGSRNSSKQYLRVVNSKHWPTEFRIYTQLLPDPLNAPGPICTDDNFEPNSEQSPRPLSLTRHDKKDRAFYPALSMCQYDEDVFVTTLFQGDKLTASALYLDEQINLRLLLLDNSTGAELGTTSGDPGWTSINHEITNFQQTKTVLLKLLQEGDRESARYALEVDIERSCTDDQYEVPNDAYPYSLEALTTIQAILCADEDRFEKTLTAGQWTVDLHFLHDYGDIDLEIRDATNTLLGTSRTKENQETVILNLPSETTIVISVKLDDNPVRTSYTLSITGQ